ncbi:E3 ubiquitin-protein ligase Siah1-like [Scomber scombrus]|uniref:E3 ubiquitin-protein ligase n=1 Tax=Scomber scombrus TaxID=13677 RepID=A0AAV1NA24_SCOSC
MEESMVEKKSDSSSKTSSSTEAGAEKVANSVLFPCKYASSGCEVTLPQTDKREHEELCDFRPYSCPYPATSCRWQGSLDAVMPHLVQKHKSIPTLQGEDVVILTIDINMPGEIFWLMMQSCFGFHFMLVLQKRRKYGGSHQFFAIVQLIGTEKQAEKFGYRLELNKPQHRLTWEARPCSIHENIASAIMNDGCLIFDTFVAHLFAQNGNLDIKTSWIKRFTHYDTCRAATTDMAIDGLDCNPLIEHLLLCRTVTSVLQ